MDLPPSRQSPYYETIDVKLIRRERERARVLKKTPWWRAQLEKGICNYCGTNVGKEALTMDHRVPLARGGKSTKGNVVPSCHACNQKKRLETEAELILKQLTSQN